MKAWKIQEKQLYITWQNHASEEFFVMRTELCSRCPKLSSAFPSQIFRGRESNIVVTSPPPIKGVRGDRAGALNSPWWFRGKAKITISKQNFRAQETPNELRNLDRVLSTDDAFQFKKKSS